MSLEKLLSPYTVDEFMAECYEVDYLHIRRNDAGYFGDLLDDLALEQHIWMNSSRWGEVSLARANTLPSDNTYANGLPTIDNIAAAFADGYTIVVNDYQRKSRRVAAFCRDVEKYFMCRSNVNLYMTAAHCQGLDAHYDDQDVFVLQLDGEKTWRIFRGGPSLPLEEQPYHCRISDPPSFSEIVLRPGDVLYLPRGFIHAAHTNAEQSLHITLSISVVRTITFLRHLLSRVAEREHALRKSISHRSLRGLADETVISLPAITTLISSIAASDIQQAYSDFQDFFFSVTTRFPSGKLRNGTSARPISIESMASLPDDQICVVSSVAGNRTLKFIGGQVQLSEELFKTAQFIRDQRRFRVQDIAGDLSDEEKIAFVTFLVERGVLLV